MPSLSLTGALIDTVGAALKAAGRSASSAASGDRDAATPATAPFAQTLQQRVDTRHDADRTATADTAPPKSADAKPVAAKADDD
ncbi:TPA: flagellar hook-length control protein FliK, partial [Burkholderia multivorans]